MLKKKPKKTSKRKFLWYLLPIVLLVLVIGGYGFIKQASQIGELFDQVLNQSSSNVLVWDEEVPLHDGRVIVIKRREIRSSGGFPINTMNSRGIVRSYEFCYPPMGFYWKSKGMYKPEILGIVAGRAYVKVPFTGAEKCMLHDYPKTNAIYFVWEGDAWKKIPYEQFPQEVRRTNLLQDSLGNTPEEDVRGLVTVAEKESRDHIYSAMKHWRRPWKLESRTDYPEYRGDCERNKSIRVKTTRTSKVFLPPTPEFCH